MPKERLAVISTKNPTLALITTIWAIKTYYPEFDIVVVDSDSTNKEMFSSVPPDVIIEYAQNKNWELGAWVYAYQKYNHYKVYLFTQDSFTPIERLSTLDKEHFPDGTLYSRHYWTTLKDGGYLDDLYDVYRNTNLHFLCNFDINKKYLGAAHSSFITNHANVPTILQMEDAYIQKKITKTKVHSLISERIGGILVDRAGNTRMDLSWHFRKQNFNRE